VKEMSEEQANDRVINSPLAKLLIDVEKAVQAYVKDQEENEYAPKTV
jgi:hypothetical protein